MPEQAEPRKAGRPKKIVEPEASAPVESKPASFVLTTNDIKVVEPIEEGYTILTSPTGAKSTVPDSIKDILIDSGYTE